jgi:cation transport ATPase
MTKKDIFEKLKDIKIDSSLYIIVGDASIVCHGIMRNCDSIEVYSLENFLVAGVNVRVVDKLEAGDKIPADARLFETVNLEVEEAILTGESLPVEKNIAVIEETSVLADMKNMVFSGTMVTK